MKVLGYVRCSTREQSDSGVGLAAQRRALHEEAARRGWELVAIHEDAGASGRSLNRPGLVEALERLEAGEADGLAVAKLDRLSRSLLDFAGLMQQFQKKGWGLVALDLGVDTSSPSGEMIANVLAVFAQFERRLIGQRTREALSVVKAEGSKSGLPIGRPRTLDDDVRSRIIALREGGATLTEIANTLNQERVPTGHNGARWWPTTVRKIVLSG